jgi:hypothetical protein
MGKAEIFGNYDFIPQGMEPEGMLSMTVQPIDLITYWRRCGLVADFGAKFYAYAYSKPNEYLENTISTVLNELVENGAKFSRQKESYVSISLRHFINVFSIEVVNETTLKIAQSFKDYVKKLLDSDLEQMYFDKLESRKEGDEGSGMGLLMLLKDYPAFLGACFENFGSDGNEYTRITIRIFLKIEE